MQFRTHKVIYRRYAGLFFSICVDITDNELAYLECIHLFVEILDHFFSNVCELDLVFNFHKVQFLSFPCYLIIFFACSTIVIHLWVFHETYGLINQ
jgi:AP-2 complex subunit sigma-1